MPDKMRSNPMEKDLRGKIFNALRYRCASEKCAETCPGYSKEGTCGIWEMADRVVALLSVPVEWPKEISPEEWMDAYSEYSGREAKAINETRKACLLAHNSIIAEKEKEIAELKADIKLLELYLDNTRKDVRKQDSKIARLRKALEEIGNPPSLMPRSELIEIASHALEGE